MGQGSSRRTETVYDHREEPFVGVTVVKSASTVYLAETDGLVSNWPGAAGCTIYSDATTNPTTVVCATSANVGGGRDFGQAQAMIVKGNYWKATGSNVMWTSIGD